MSAGHYERLGKAMDTMVEAIRQEVRVLRGGHPDDDALSALSYFLGKHPGIIREDVRRMVAGWLQLKREDEERRNYEQMLRDREEA